MIDTNDVNPVNPLEHDPKVIADRIEEEIIECPARPEDIKQETDWIEMREFYIYSKDEWSWLALSKKYGASAQLIGWHAKRDHWVDDRIRHIKAVGDELGKRLIRSQAMEKHDLILKTSKCLDKMEKYLFKSNKVKNFKGEVMDVDVERRCTWSEFKGMMQFLNDQINFIKANQLDKSSKEEPKSAEDMSSKYLEQLKQSHNG